MADRDPTISFCADRFEPEPAHPETTFAGRDLARYLHEALELEQGDFVEEDWGWAVFGRHRGRRVLIGVYDHDLEESPPRWVLRLSDDSFQWNPLAWFRSGPRPVPPGLADQVLSVLERDPGITDVRHVE